MGVNLNTFRGLLDLSGRFRPEGPSLMLGRQAFKPGQTKPNGKRRFAEALAKQRPGASLDDLRQSDGYSETLFQSLGFGEIESLDYSEYQGATRLWDLNRPVPGDWHGRYGFIFDGGTLEHVFNVAQALENVHDMLRPGGRLVSVTPLNGYPGHGFYQFGPELVWSFWHRGKGCIVHACRAIEPSGSFVADLQDPAKTGHRPDLEVGPRWRGKMPSDPVLMWYEVERTEASGTGMTLQSDYQASWERTT